MHAITITKLRKSSESRFCIAFCLYPLWTENLSATIDSFQSLNYLEFDFDFDCAQDQEKATDVGYRRSTNWKRKRWSANTLFWAWPWRLMQKGKQIIEERNYLFGKLMMFCGNNHVIDNDIMILFLLLSRCNQSCFFNFVHRFWMLLFCCRQGVSLFFIQHQRICSC